MAIYIDTHFVAHQYLLCQPDVESETVVFNSLTESLWLMQDFLG
jgi:hypothetical protein